MRIILLKKHQSLHTFILTTGINQSGDFFNDLFILSEILVESKGNEGMPSPFHEYQMSRKSQYLVYGRHAVALGGTGKTNTNQ